VNERAASRGVRSTESPQEAEAGNGKPAFPTTEYAGRALGYEPLVIIAIAFGRWTT